MRECSDSCPWSEVHEEKDRKIVMVMRMINLLITQRLEILTRTWLWVGQNVWVYTTCEVNR